jgi:hypothetical protein
VEVNGGDMHDPERHNTAPNKVSDEIQAFYDRHPYPPPMADLDRYRQLWRQGDRRRVEHHLLWPATSASILMNDPMLDPKTLL